MRTNINFGVRQVNMNCKKTGQTQVQIKDLDTPTYITKLSNGFGPVKNYNRADR